MKILLISLIVFFSEAILTYLINMRNVKVIRKEKWKATLYDIGVSSFWWTTMALAFYTQQILIIIVAICGSALGTFIAAMRKEVN